MQAHLIRPLAFLSPLALAAALGGCSAYESGTDFEGDVTRHTSLVQYQSCSELEADLEDTFIAELETRFERAQGRGGYGVPESDQSAEPTSGGDDRTEGEDFSGTNNQEDGVDEADFVKTDGYHVYVVNGNSLHIFGVPEFGDLNPVSSFEIEGRPREMLVDRDAGRAVVFSQIYPGALPEEHPLREAVGAEAVDGWYWRVPVVSKVTVIDMSDRGNPQLHREIFMEGRYQTARKTGSSVRMGSFSWMSVPGLSNWWWYYSDSEYERARAFRRARNKILAADLGDMVPRIYERRPDGSFEPRPLTGDACNAFQRPENSHGRGVTSLISFDLLGEDLHYDADHVVTNRPTIYASRDYLYIAEPAHDWWWFWWNEDHEEQLNVHMFNIGASGESTYLASGRVRGVLHNQFSLDEQDGYLRVATTENFWNRWWLEDAPEAQNHVYVMDRRGRDLETVGHVGGIAEGERIYSARFVGDKGYLVTFRQVDPLFTLDLSDPEDPAVVGELKVEGFSTYIHPIADDRLLTIGVGGDENGANWRAQVSMFDVSDFSAPGLVDTQSIAPEEGWGWSEALYEHKAFQYWAPEKLLAVPMSSYNYDAQTGAYSYTSKLELLEIDPETGVAPYGQVDHSHLFNQENRLWHFRDIRRSIFMGDYLYAISDRGITVHELGDLSVVDEAELPGFDPNAHYWWW